MSFDLKVPEVTFKTRVQTDESPGFEWKDVTSSNIFAGQRVVLIALPGAFTPTCSSTHLPGYDANYDEILSYGVNEVYCLSVNDSFTMNAWFDHLEVQNVKPIPDGSGDFTRKLGMLVKKDNLGFGMRSWRYSAVVNNGTIEAMFIEPGMMDDCPADPFEVSDAYSMMNYLKTVAQN